jgi:hypothetical protein
MNRRRVLQGLLALWGVWEVLNAALSMFAPAAGASLVGWVANWNDPQLFAMSQQYGLAMFLLGAVYLIAATDPVRYRVVVWLVVAEQVLGILLGAYNTFGLNQLTTTQFITQVVINVVVMVIFLIVGTGLTPDTMERDRVRTA